MADREGSMAFLLPSSTLNNASALCNDVQPSSPLDTRLQSSRKSSPAIYNPQLTLSPLVRWHWEIAQALPFFKVVSPPTDGEEGSAWWFSRSRGWLGPKTLPPRLGYLQCVHL